MEEFLSHENTAWEILDDIFESAILHNDCDSRTYLCELWRQDWSYIVKKYNSVLSSSTLDWWKIGIQSFLKSYFTKFGN